jgi:hypothetical protein
MGPAAVLAGVFIRMESMIASSGERVVSGLVQKLGALEFVSDNAGCFGSRPFPRNGRFITFGTHEVYVRTGSVCRYPEWVLKAADPFVFYFVFLYSIVFLQDFLFARDLEYQCSENSLMS